ncbi:MAG: hypothetical protein V4525_14940 [Pseudomonadota bacterium]
MSCITFTAQLGISSIPWWLGVEGASGAAFNKLIGSSEYLLRLRGI